MSRDNSKCRFQVAVILKSNMADIKIEFQVAQYLKMFPTYYRVMYVCAKFGACITKCTIHVNVWAKSPHYKKAMLTTLTLTFRLC